MNRSTIRDRNGLEAQLHKHSKRATVLVSACVASASLWACGAAPAEDGELVDGEVASVGEELIPVPRLVDRYKITNPTLDRLEDLREVIRIPDCHLYLESPPPQWSSGSTNADVGALQYLSIKRTDQGDSPVTVSLRAEEDVPGMVELATPGYPSTLTLQPGETSAVFGIRFNKPGRALVIPSSPDCMVHGFEDDPESSPYYIFRALGRVTLTPDSLSLEVGDTAQVTVTANPRPEDGRLIVANQAVLPPALDIPHTINFPVGQNQTTIQVEAIGEYTGVVYQIQNAYYYPGYLEVDVTSEDPGPTEPIEYASAITLSAHAGAGWYLYGPTTVNDLCGSGTAMLTEVKWNRMAGGSERFTLVNDNGLSVMLEPGTAVSLQPHRLLAGDYSGQVNYMTQNDAPSYASMSIKYMCE
jgi:hypothetical protein